MFALYEQPRLGWYMADLVTPIINSPQVVNADDKTLLPDAQIKPDNRLSVLGVIITKDSKAFYFVTDVAGAYPRLIEARLVRLYVGPLNIKSKKAKDG